MLDFMFFVKTMALTFLIMIAMQTKWGDSTVEDHAMEFIRSSALTQPLHRMASSGAHAVRESTKWLAKQVNQKIRGHHGQSSEASLGGRAQSFQFKRSEGYERKKAESEAAAKRGSSPQQDE